MTDENPQAIETYYIGCPRCGDSLSGDPEKVLILGYVVDYWCDDCSIKITEKVEPEEAYALPDGRRAIPVDYRVPEDWEWVASEDRKEAWQVGPDTPRPQPKRVILEVMDNLEKETDLCSSG